MHRPLLAPIAQATLSICAFASLSAAQSGGSLPAGFALAPVTTQLAAPTCMALASDGRIFVGELDGDVWLIQNGALVTPALVSIPTGVVQGSAGLLGLALDPLFEQNGFLYAYYTSSEPRNRVSRFTVVGSSASLGSELVLWQNIHSTPGDHNGGGLAFGADGDLYISTGDQFVSAYSQDLAREDGKLLRIARDGSIPLDNPYLSDPSAQPTIFARGLRNPFRMTVDSVGGQIWIADVGGNGLYSWEEADRAFKGANFGWPFQEGATCYVSNCSAFAAAPFAYRHDDPNFVAGTAQGSLTACCVYRSSVFPLAYRGNLFLGDYSNRWIKRAIFDAQGNLSSVQPFLDSADAGPIVALDVGPDGALYFLTFGTPTSHGGGGASGLWRIAYNSSGNLPPVANASATPSTGPAPLAVQFSSAGSFDPDNGPQPLQSFWDFGDGTSTTVDNPLVTFNKAGTYSVMLSVSDGAATSTTTPLVVSVGTPPVPTIAAPTAGASYIAGSTIQLDGSAVDADDGALAASALTWRVELVHAGHVHPFFGPITGVAQTSFVVPASGHPPEDTYLKVYLTAVDSDGLQATASVALAPSFVDVAVDTWPSGIPVFIDGQAENTPRDYQSLPNYALGLEAQRSFVLGGRLWLFNRWSDGQSRAHSIATPPTGASVRALYAPAIVSTKRVVVPADVRNAEWTAASGQAFSSPLDPKALRFGRAASGNVLLALEFLAPIPQGATITSAFVQFTAASQQSGHVVTPIQAYAVGDAPAFVAGSPTALDAWSPLTSANVLWYAPNFTAGQTIATPDLTTLLQEVVDRADWASGQALGLVFEGSTTLGSAMRSLANFASGDPAQLVVTFAVAPPRAPTPPSTH